MDPETTLDEILVHLTHVAQRDKHCADSLAELIASLETGARVGMTTPKQRDRLYAFADSIWEDGE